MKKTRRPNGSSVMTVAKVENIKASDDSPVHTVIHTHSPDGKNRGFLIVGDLQTLNDFFYWWLHNVEPEIKSLGQGLRVLRLRKRLKVEDVATGAKMSRRKVLNWEQGHPGDYSWEHLRKILGGLNCRVRDLKKVVSRT